jgi:serine/threonine protein kinase
MPAVATIEQFLETVRKSGLVDEKALNDYLDAARTAGSLPDTPQLLARAMVRDGIVTHFQAGQFLAGKSRGFILNGKYKLLEHLGAGGMGTVYLCEHTSMRRRVAIKVLPIVKAQDPSYLERFYREARAVAALDHPNIVRAHDIDHDDKLHFLVMEYVDGSSLQEIVSKHGPLDITRAAHYMAQAALGLQHAHEAGLVHRDIKPGNILVDRSGTVKVLDMGLARFFHDDDNLSKKYDETVLGTSDYLAPEQTLNSNVDIRADIYSLGATFYYCLTGQTLFGEGTAAQKLIWHQTRQPKPIRSVRPEVPEELADLIENRMLAKDAAERFQTPVEIADALTPWTAMPIDPPPADEMPKLSPAASRFGSAESTVVGPSSGGTGSSPSGTKRSWTVSGSSSPRPVRAPATGRRPSASGPLTVPTPPTRIATGKSTGPRVAGRKAGQAEANGDQPEADGENTAASRPSGTDLLAAAARGNNRLPLIAAAAVLGVLLIAGTSAGVWWLFLTPARPARPGQGAPNQAFYPAPTTAPAVAVPRAQAAPKAEPVSIRPDGAVRRVHAPAYDATVEGDGCLTSLRIGGTEFLHAGGPISRGSYFFQLPGGALKLPTVEQEGDNVLTARGDKASIRYEFAPDAMTWAVTNGTDAPMSFFLVFDPAVKVVINDKGQWARTPVERNWAATSWFAGRSRLALNGANRLWGPFEEKYQVWEASLGPRETRRLSLQAGAPSPAEAQQATRHAWEKHFSTPAYEATVEGDGCLTSLRVGGAEVLSVGWSTSRGVYFHDGNTLQLPDVEEPSADVVTARGDKASIRYEFGQDGMTWTVSNLTDKPLSFFMVLGPAVTAVSNDKGDWAKTPTKQEWKTTTWFTDKAKFTVTGGTRIWGPWAQQPGQALQVWDGGLAPHETREVTLKVGSISGPEASKIASLTGARPAVETDLAIASPVEYQVFQRYSRNRGQIALQGKVRQACDKVEVRVSGTSLEGKLPDRWQNVAFDRGNRSFDTTLPTPAGGWYKLELRALQGQKVVAEDTVDHVGIGEVFVMAGQSNSTNCGEEQLRPQTGLVASFSGTNWQPADDPQPGVHDKTGGGSPWPAFGDALAEKYHVPIGIVSTGHSGSSVNQWQAGGEFFNHMMARVRKLGSGGFRALLWHQGESDVGMKADQYARLLTNVIEASKKEAGWDFPWFVAQVSYQAPDRSSFPSTRDAQKDLWDKGVALEGPDSDALTGDNRDQGGKGIHFSGKGLRAHGKLWAEKVSAYLDKTLAE